MISPLEVCASQFGTRDRHRHFPMALCNWSDVSRWGAEKKSGTIGNEKGRETNVFAIVPPSLKPLI
jgi:hypothetical protein